MHNIKAGGHCSSRVLPATMKKIVLLTALLGVIHGRKTFHGDQVLRVHAENVIHFTQLQDLIEMDHLKLDVWKAPTPPLKSVDIHVPSTSLKNVKQHLEDQNIQYSVMIPDLQVVLDEEQHKMLKENGHRPQPNTTDDYDYGRYHTLNEIYRFMDMLVAENPKLVSKLQIGNTHEKNPLYVLKFSRGGSNRPAVWIDTGIHSREWVTQACGTLFAKKIVQDYGRDRSLTSILDNMDIFLEIVVNPDGYIYTHTQNRMWRKNRRPHPRPECFGVDLNRNWNIGFGGQGSSGNPCSDLYRGPSAHSELEVKSIADFVKSHRNLKAFVSIHSYSQMLLYPYGYTRTPARDQAILHKVAAEAVARLASLYGTKYSYGSVVNIIYQASGGTIDWTYNQGIRYSYTFELRDTGRHGFLLPADQIIPTAEETWLALMVIMQNAMTA